MKWSKPYSPNGVETVCEGKAPAWTFWAKHVPGTRGWTLWYESTIPTVGLLWYVKAKNFTEVEQLADTMVRTGGGSRPWMNWKQPSDEARVPPMRTLRRGHSHVLRCYLESEITSTPRGMAMDATTYLDAVSVASANLHQEDDRFTQATDRLRSLILAVRHVPGVAVREMATAIDRDRNYIDSVTSTYQGSPAVLPEPEEGQDKAQYKELLLGLLTAAQTEQDTAYGEAKIARVVRDRAIVEAYKADVRGRPLGPSAIGAAAHIDRNHVSRIVKNAGVKPRHRSNIANQYSRKAA